MVVLVFYLLHCIMSIAHLLGSGMGPHHITFTPLEATMSYTIAQPDILYTEVNYQEWLKANAPSTSTSIEPLAQQETDTPRHKWTGVLLSSRWLAQGYCYP